MPKKFDEPIERMIVHFTHQEVIPIKFKWKGRWYKIKETHTFWHTDEGTDQEEFHITATTTEGHSIELAFNVYYFTWRLRRIVESK